MNDKAGQGAQKGQKVGPSTHNMSPLLHSGEGEAVQNVYRLPRVEVPLPHEYDRVHDGHRDDGGDGKHQGVGVPHHLPVADRLRLVGGPGDQFN